LCRFPSILRHFSPNFLHKTSLLRPFFLLNPIFFEIKKAGRPGDALRLARLARALPHPDPVLRMLARIGRDHSGGGLVVFGADFGVFKVFFGAGIGFSIDNGRKMSTIGAF
jgi:hypothetical protein